MIELSSYKYSFTQLNWGIYGGMLFFSHIYNTVQIFCKLNPTQT